MNKLQIFEPALCCPTGVCGPSVDPELLRMTAVLNNLKRHNIIVDRFNLMNDPDEFIKSEVVNAIIHTEGVEALPLVVLNGEVVKKSSYPTNEEICTYLNIERDQVEAPKSFGFNMKSEGC